MTIGYSPVVTPERIAARAAYAALFMLALPVLLAVWAVRLDAWLSLPTVRSEPAGAALMLAGLVLMAAAMRDLWVYGGGLPASPFPPQRLVRQGTYRLFQNPIYVGAAAAAFGVSLFVGSPAGLWVVSPVLALAATAFVLGFERDATARRFGTISAPLLRIPGSTLGRPLAGERLAVYLLVFLPWLVLYQAVESLGVPPDAVVAYFQWEADVPVVPWTEPIYASTYLFVLAVPLVARRSRDLREFARGGLWATALIIPLYLLVPLIAPARPVPGTGFWSDVMRWERAHDAAVTAFPAFHVVWTCLAARLWAITYPRLRAAWWTLAVAIAISCLTTGMHAMADVLAGLGFSVAVARRRRLWRVICDGAEWVANASKTVTIGPVRLLADGAFTAAAAAAGVLISIHLAGRESAAWMLLTTAAAIVGAGLWGQLVEGSSRLLRPYGYFGSVVAVVVVVALGAVLAGVDGWRLFTAFGVGAAFSQAIGRLRCLTNGCCHGGESEAWMGIRYTHPRSRVTRLTTLAGKPLHPTPLYSAIWMLFVGVVLLRLWWLGAPLPFIAGAYFILTGLGRFVEEHFRGEPQTAVIGGLRLYQWLAIVFVVAGAVLTTLGTNTAPVPQPLDRTTVPVILAAGLMGFAAYGVDFPRSGRRFSRLV